MAVLAGVQKAQGTAHKCNEMQRNEDLRQAKKKKKKKKKKSFEIWCLILFTLTHNGSPETCSERNWAKFCTLLNLFKVLVAINILLPCFYMAGFKIVFIRCYSVAFHSIFHFI